MTGQVFDPAAPLCPMGLVRAARTPAGRKPWRGGTQQMPGRHCWDCEQAALRTPPRFWAKFHDACQSGSYHAWA